MTIGRTAIIAILLFVAAARAEDGPYDLLQKAYAPFMAADDPLAFSMKVRSISTDSYTFWRGSKDLFFVWCKSNAADWFADRGAFVPNHGDLHLGNIGSYACDGGWNKLAFGMVDFDDSALLPFQVELLQGLITLQLTARQNSITLDEAAQQQLETTLLDTYRTTVNSRRNATAFLTDADDPLIKKMLERRSTPYQRDLDEYISQGAFRGNILSGKGKLKEIFRPAPDMRAKASQGLAQAVINEPDLAGVLAYQTESDFSAAIIDVAQRTRLGSSGSQGLKKYFIYLKKPFKGVDTDGILYLKQEIPSAAERSGIIPMNLLSPGRRVKQDMDRLTEPRPLVNSWCDIGGESYWVTLKEPWSDELDPSQAKSFVELLHLTRIWAIVAGATHREDGRFEAILPSLTPELHTQLHSRAAEFVKYLDNEFTAMQKDSRTAEQLARVERLLDSIHIH